ncbi:MAG: hypothetical protein KDB53_16235, partial [Planctomycetes bacterium]|nr:hypothetical protein [Planctomycetota bacterium]
MKTSAWSRFCFTWMFVLGLVVSSLAQNQVADIRPGAGSSNTAFEFVEFNGLMYFAADDGANGKELWRSDGTMAGTMMVKDINTTGSSSPAQFCVAAGKLFFAANDGVNGTELWVSDGTALGTVLLKDLNTTTATASSFPTEMTAYDAAGSGVVFAATDGIEGRELYVSDGTPGGTGLLLDINPGGFPIFGPFQSNPVGFTRVGNLVFFSAKTETDGEELWVTDGSTANQVMDIFPGVSILFSQPNSSSPRNLTAVGSFLYFTARTVDAAVNSSGDEELWASDGT